jgi:hypothetical protein
MPRLKRSERESDGRPSICSGLMYCAVPTTTPAAAAVPPPSNNRRDCPAELDRIVLKCLEKSADRRYQTARDLFLDLERIGKQELPRSRQSLRPILYGAALLVLLAAITLVWIFTHGIRRQAAAPHPVVNSVAVLPFVNMSPDRANDYIADGTTEEIINALAQLRNVKVVSRTSVFAFK